MDGLISGGVGLKPGFYGIYNNILPVGSELSGWYNNNNNNNNNNNINNNNNNNNNINNNNTNNNTNTK